MTSFVRMCAMCDEIAGMEAYSRYIVDFGITPLVNDDPHSGRILIIEVNPYLPTTDSGLFCWVPNHSCAHCHGSPTRDV